MPTPPDGMRLCPTRVDGAVALIAHTISLPRCQERQREHFHKCPTCTHHNGSAIPALIVPADARKVAAKVG